MKTSKENRSRGPEAGGAGKGLALLATTSDPSNDSNAHVDISNDLVLNYSENCKKKKKKKTADYLRSYKAA